MRDSAGISIVESSAPEWAHGTGWTVEPTPVVSIGSADGAPECQLTNVSAVVELSDGRIVVADGGSMQLRTYTPDGRCVRAVGGRGRGPGEFSRVTVVSRYRGDSILRRIVASEEKTFGIRPFPPTYPAFGAVMVDDGGFVWVERFARPGVPTADTKVYAVFAQHGRWLGDVRFPARFTLSAATVDHVIGVEANDLDVQYVRVYRISGRRQAPSADQLLAASFLMPSPA